MVKLAERIRRRAVRASGVPRGAAEKVALVPVEQSMAFRAGEDGRLQKTSRTWYRGDNCNFNPTKPDMGAANAVRDYILKGWMPALRMIGPNTKIVAFGSCFAANIADWLATRNFNVLTKKGGDAKNAYVVQFGEGMVNTFAIRQQFEWAFEGKKPEEELWHGYDAKANGYDEDVREQTRALFDTADVFILTFGLSEVWYDEKTGGVFWRGVPTAMIDPDRHKFRVSTVAENKANIHAIFDLIRKYRPSAKIIATLSPVPLTATFRAVSCITANSASKAILRAALDEVFRERPETGTDLFYWPSYEIVLDLFGERWKPDRRHPKDEILDFIMVLFESMWCYGTKAKMAPMEALLRAKVSDGSFPVRLAEALAAGKANFLKKWRDGGTQRDREIIALMEARASEIVAADPESKLAALLP